MSQRKQKLASGLIVTVVIISLIGLLINYFNKPVTGTVLHAPPQEQSATTTNASQMVHGKYISFSYPSSFSSVPASTPTAGQLEIFEYIKRPAPFWNLNIEVSRLPSGNIKDDGSYNLRLANPSQYQLSSWSISGQSVPVFSSSATPYSKVAYVLNGGHVASIALSGNPSASQDLDDVLKKVLSSLEWQ